MGDLMLNEISNVTIIIIESKFELIIKKPEVGKIQMGIFGVFLFLLLVRCICVFI